MALRERAAKSETRIVLDGPRRAPPARWARRACCRRQAAAMRRRGRSVSATRHEARTRGDTWRAAGSSATRAASHRRITTYTAGFGNKESAIPAFGSVSPTVPHEPLSGEQRRPYDHRPSRVGGGWTRRWRECEQRGRAGSVLRTQRLAREGPPARRGHALGAERTRDRGASAARHLRACASERSLTGGGRRNPL